MRCLGYLGVKKKTNKQKQIKRNRTKQDKRICFLLSVSFVFGSKVYSFPESLIVALIRYSKITRSAIPRNKVVNKKNDQYLDFNKEKPYLRVLLLKV